MCGLVSLISKRGWGFNNKDLDVFEELLTVDQLRGQDATGAFCVQRNRQVSGIKIASTPWHLFKQPEYNGFKNKAQAQGRILVGHNRKATQGAATNPANAHPFQEDNIILVHNGSLYNRMGLPDRDVDSHAVAAAFAEGSYDEVLKDINGAYAFIWWDMKRNKLSVVRNKERPLWKLENKDMMVFCSEVWMGLGVLRRNGYGGKGEEFEMSEVPVDKIFHYEIGGKLVEEEGVKKVPVVVTPKTTTTSSHGNGGQCVATPTTTKQETVQHTSFPFAPPPFRVGTRILVQLNNVRATSTSENAVFACTGITVEPGRPIVDCSGILPNYVTHDSVARWLQFPLSAEVVEARTTIRGPTVRLKHLSMAALVQTHPTGIITQQDWDFVVEHCTCKKCNSQIGEYEPGFTSVKLGVENDKRVYSVTCADCIEEMIRDEEVKKEFTEGRIDALQKWEQVGLRSGAGTEQPATVQGNSTTH